MEYLNFKSLDHFIRKNRHFTETEAIFIISQILQALNYMHSKGICHRDIKPKNILVDQQNGDFFIFLWNNIFFF